MKTSVDVIENVCGCEYADWAPSMASSWMENPSHKGRSLLKHQSPFPVLVEQRRFTVRATSLLSCATGGPLSPIRRGNQSLFLSNSALGAVPLHQQQQ